MHPNDVWLSLKLQDEDIKTVSLMLRAAYKNNNNNKCANCSEKEAGRTS